MQNDSVGLKSLEKRLTMLEQFRSNVSNNSKTDLVVDFENMKKDDRTKKMNEINEKYRKKVHTKIKAEGPSDFVSNISKVVKQTVKFVEKHSKTISKVFDVAVSSSLKLNTALKFIQSIINGAVDQDMLIGLINHFVEMLFNKKTLTFKKILHLKNI